jgi:uncharacterized protein YbbC (DUF1343 family)
MMSAVSFLLGSDVLFDRQLLSGRRIGLVCNPASVNAAFTHVIDKAERAGVRVGAIFGPQHGFRSDLQENMIESSHGEDERRQVPIYSLYSETREPTADMLAGLDALVVDLQDVGTRIYTYIYTMANCLRAARRHDLPIVICDRPNPIGGVAIEGPMLEPGFESFVGQYPLPIRHALTMGELGRLFNDHFGIGAKLEVIAMPSWSRAAYADELGLPWVLPSPNIPTLESAIVYPGTVLFEGTNVSEGRGTTKPFELVGAPWVAPEPFAAQLNARDLPGVHFRPALFEPTFHKHASTSCGGCQVHVTNRQTFRPVETGIALLQAFRDVGPDRFAWREPPYEYEYLLAPIDILCGSSDVRERLEHGEEASDIARSWQSAVEAFDLVRSKFLLY